jgi:hypothetical protein
MEAKRAEEGEFGQFSKGTGLLKQIAPKKKKAPPLLGQRGDVVYTDV